MQNCSAKIPYLKEAFILLVRQEWSKSSLRLMYAQDIWKYKWIFSSHGKTNITKRSLRRLGKMLIFYSHHCALISHLFHSNWGTCSISIQHWRFSSKTVLLLSDFCDFKDKFHWNRVLMSRPKTRNGWCRNVLTKTKVTFLCSFPSFHKTYSIFFIA